MTEHKYSNYPDTSDKRDDECWVDYWDRKRRELHAANPANEGKPCGCALCYTEDILHADHSWCDHTWQQEAAEYHLKEDE